MNFNFVGKIAPMKETEKFKPYSVDTWETSGWTRKLLLFSAVDGDNTHVMTAQGGTFLSKPDNTVKTMTAIDMGEGEKPKYEWIEIPWADRLKPENIKKVVKFKKWTIDLNPMGYRKKITDAFMALKDKGVTDEILKSVGLTSEAEVEDAYKKAKDKYFEFIAEWDFVEQMHKIVSDPEYQSKKFHINGTIEKQLSEKNLDAGKVPFYTALRPQNVRLAGDDEEESCVGSALLHFTNGAVDDASLEEKGKYYVKAYTMEYASSRKNNGKNGNVPAEFQLVVPRYGIYNKNTKKPDESGKLSEYIIEKQFTVDDYKVYAMGVEFDMIEGREKVAVTEDMLDDNQREMVELGIVSMEEVVREMGGSAYGDKIIEYRYKGQMYGYTKGRQETAYTEDDLVLRPLALLALEDKPDKGEDAEDVEEELAGIFNVEKVSSSKKEEDEDDDLFS